MVIEIIKIVVLFLIYGLCVMYQEEMRMSEKELTIVSTVLVCLGVLVIYTS